VCGCSEKLCKPDLVRGASVKARGSSHALDHAHEAEDIPSSHPSLLDLVAASGGGVGAHVSPTNGEGVARQRSSSQGGLIRHVPSGLFIDDGSKEEEEARHSSASPLAAANSVLWRGLVMSGRQGAMYQITHLACQHSHAWPVLGAFAERVDSEGGEDLAWDAPRPRVYVTALMCRSGVGGQDRRLGKLKEAVELFRRLPKSTAFVKVHDHMLVRGAGNAVGELDAAYAVVMDRCVCIMYIIYMHCRDSASTVGL
jgi:hypothetical protein